MLEAHISILAITVLLCVVLDGFPVRGSNRDPLGGCRVFLHSPGIFQGSGPFFVLHHPVRDPAVNYGCWIPCLLTSSESGSPA